MDSDAGHPEKLTVTCPTIYVVNNSAHVTDDELVKVCAAHQRDLAENFQGVWNEYAVIHACKKGETPPSASMTAWIFTLQDGGADPGVLAFHQDSKYPSAIIDVAACIADGASWASALNHEEKEALVDAICTLCAEANGKLYAYEVCDMLEGKPYQVDGVDCECFCTPNWFIPGSEGPWDFPGPGVAPVLEGPLTLTPQGYVMFKADAGDWQQTNGALARRAKQTAAAESRRAKRIKTSGGDPAKLVVSA